MEWVEKGTREADVEASARAIWWHASENTPCNRVCVFGHGLHKLPHEWWNFFGTSLWTCVVMHNKKQFVNFFKRLILYNVSRVVQFAMNFLSCFYWSLLIIGWLIVVLFFMALSFLSSTSLSFLWLYWFNSHFPWGSWRFKILITICLFLVSEKKWSKIL
jgi:hypothetical protein